MPGRIHWIAASRLWLVTDRQACQPRSLTEGLLAAIPAGIDVVVFRMKDAAEDEFLEHAQQVKVICGSFGIPLVVSHNPAVAADLGAAGAHLGAGDPPLDAVRQLVPGNMAIGNSTHSVEEARSCLEQGYDYVFLGPVFPSPEKLKYGQPLGESVLEETTDFLDRVVFIGGFGVEQTKVAARRGARHIAAIRAFQDAANGAANTTSMARILEAMDQSA